MGSILKHMGERGNGHEAGWHLTSGRLLFKTTAKSILKASIAFNSPGFIPLTPPLALIPLLTACLLQPLRGHCPSCAGRAGHGPPAAPTRLAGRSWPAPVQPGEIQGGPEALGRGGGCGLARGIGSSEEIHQVLAPGSDSSQTQFKAPQAPPSPGPQSWQGRLPEGYMQEQPRVLQEIPAQAGDRDLPLSSSLSRATHQAMLGGLAQTSCHRHLLHPPPTLRDAVVGMLFS